MNFSKLRHRIIFLSPTDEIINSMGETVPRYKPFKPYLPLPLQMQKNKSKEDIAFQKTIARGFDNVNVKNLQLVLYEINQAKSNEE